MALDKQTISVPFVQGPDTKSDQRLSNKPARLEHSVFTTGDLNKHNGRKLLPASISGGGTQSSGEAIFPFNAELVRINGGTAYGFSDSTDTWVTKPGGNNYCTTSLRSMVSQTTSAAGAFDHYILGNIGVIAWVQSGIHVAVYDVATGTFFQGGVNAISGSSTTSYVPRLVAVGGKVVVLWLELLNLCSAVIDTSSPTTAPTRSLIRSDVYGSAITFDAVTYNGAFAAVAYPTTGTNIRLIGVDASGAVTASPATTSTSAVSANGLQAGVLVQRDTAGRIYVVAGDKTAHSTRYFVVDNTFASVLAPTDIVTTGNWDGTDAEFYAGASIELTPNAITLVLCAGASTVNAAQSLGGAVVNASAVATAFAILPATAGLFIQGDLVAYDGTAAFSAVNTSLGLNLLTPVNGLESSAHIITVDGKVIARGLLYQSASGLNPTIAADTPRVCRSFAQGQSAKFLFNQQGRANFQISGAGTILSVTALNIVQLLVQKASAGALPIVTVGQTAYIGGGYPRTYDGRLLGETGFALYPTLTTSLTDAGAGNLSAGTYQYCWLYSWTNANGELVRGPPSPVASIALAVSHQTSFKVGAMPLAMRDLVAAGTATRIEVYRTIANGTTFYRQSSLLTGSVNQTTSASQISLTDNISDASLQIGELLYTTGGVLDWDPPPAYSSACAHQNRLVVLPSEQPYAFMPSSVWSVGEQVRFSSDTAQFVPSDTGPLTGVASMDGNLLLFTQSACYMTYGDGPDALGNNNYPPVQLVAGVDAGPLPGSPIDTVPMGVAYQSSKGLTLLDRALNQRFFGADVEAYSTGPWTLRSITTHPTLQQVHFQVDDGRDLPGAQTGQLVPTQGGFRLVYDYYYDQWSTDPAWGAQDACIQSGTYIQVRSDGACFQETPGLYLDNGTPYTSLVETPWFKMAGIQGYQRLYYVEFLGTCNGPFTFTLDVAYSYAATEPTVPYFDPSDTVTLATDGVFTPGGSFSIRHHLGKKCSAVKFRIRDASVSGSGQGMGLTDLSFEFGVKKGLFKLPATQTA